MNTAECNAYAKINLSLDITGRREDGYHTVDMVMQSVSLCDRVRVTLNDTGEVILKCSKPHIPCDGRNTAYAAAEAVDFALGKINKPVETDCSAFMMLCAISAGATELKKLFKRQGNSCTTYCMLHDWPTTGQFEMLSGKKFLTDDRWLRRGDILVSQGHTVMALDDGEMEDENMDKDRFAELFGQMRKDLQDNDCSQYSEEARQWATEKGIVLGGGTLEDGEPNYMWQDMMTREQFVTVLYRFAKLAGLA